MKAKELNAAINEDLKPYFEIVENGENFQMISKIDKSHISWIYSVEAVSYFTVNNMAIRGHLLRNGAIQPETNSDLEIIAEL